MAKCINKTLKMISYFLSLYNFHLEEDCDLEVRNKLLDFDNIIIYDKYCNPIGNLYIDEKYNLYINVFLENQQLVAYGQYNEESFGYNLSYEQKDIYDDQKLLSNILMLKKSQFGDYLFINEMLLFKNDKFKLKCSFNTFDNRFYITNKDDKETVVYKNNSFLHKKRFIQTVIESDRDSILYEKILSNEKSISGGVKILYPYVQRSSYVENEFRKIIDEIDEEYIECINKTRNLINVFGENLFENAAIKTLKNLSDKKINCLLDIPYESYNSYQKKLK